MSVAPHCSLGPIALVASLRIVFAAPNTSDGSHAEI
jgi:hypothetical protein